MSPSFYGNILMAMASLRAAKLRSFLTMLGVIIGVVSVVTVVSIGEGIKQQISNQINQMGRDLITIRPGDGLKRQSGAADSIKLFYTMTNSGSLDPHDPETVAKAAGVRQAVPLALVTGAVKVADNKYDNPLVLASSQGLDSILADPIEFGEFFQNQDLNDQPNVAILGHDAAEHYFGERMPLGRSFDYLGQTFFVRGIMKKFDTTPLSLSTDFNDAIIIPYSTAQSLTNDNIQLYEVLARPQSMEALDQTVSNIDKALKSAHSGQQRYSVLRQDQSLSITNRILNLLTLLIAGIAAISLLVGGIGIMDVMLVSVAERMHEIGLRKALGASNRQIMLQFLTEAGVLSFMGGVIGVIVSLLLNFALRVTTPLTPVISWQAIGLSVAVSWIVGILFGTAPAVKAARKDPIEALRSY